MTICKKCNIEFIKTKNMKNSKYCNNCKFITIKCDNCNKYYTITSSYYSLKTKCYNSQYCSSQCKKDSFKAKIKTKICHFCNNEFKTTKKTNYCSEYCKTHVYCIKCNNIIQISGKYGHSTRYCKACRIIITHEQHSNFRKLPEQVLKIKQRNRERVYKLKHIKHNFTYDQWKNKLLDTNGICPMCNMYIGIDKLSIDHIIPISKVSNNYTYEIDGVQPLCISCNSRKNNR